MADDFAGTNTEKIDKLIVAVVDIRASLRTMKWIVGLGLPLLVMLFGLSWRDQSNRISDLGQSVGKLDGLMGQAIEPFKAAANDMKSAAKDLKEAAETGNRAAANMKSGSEDLARVVKRLEAFSARTSELSGVIVLNDTNLKPEGWGFQANIPLPETVDPAKLREIKVRFAAGTPLIPGTSGLLLTARPEGKSYWVQLLVPAKEVDAVGKFVFEEKKALQSDVGSVRMISRN